ncbi:MAG: C39 family peptidase [Candidatus Veblenbacteria bacterium]|nr:C39 family peptidase [Candidatus Veblenbacteria bacterium]
MLFSRKMVLASCGVIALLGLAAVATNFIVGRILPASKENTVPFTSQAPEGDWQEPWQNACEEASIVMVQNFYKDEDLTIEKAREQILAVFQLKKETAPASQDESLERVAEIINSGDLIWQARVVTEPSLAMIKAELAANHPIIAPVYAPLLNNPNYTSPGPLYHVIVITGYDDASGEFITNDPGTDMGKDNRYPYEVLLAAVHDYLANKDYTAGIKRLLFTELR